MNQKSNKFLKNETLFQTLYRINKQIKIPEKNNYNGKKIKNERMECENKYDHHYYDNTSRNKIISHENQLENILQADSKYTENENIYCDICNETLYSRDTRDTSNNNKMHKCCDICNETLYSKYSNTERDKSEKNDEHYKKMTYETSAQETSAQETSAQETSAQETSAQETSAQETSKKNIEQSESITHETPKISIKSENTSLSTKTYDDTSHDMSSAISDNYSRESTNIDDHSILLIKIISNLEERLNSLETKKNKKKK